VDGNRLSIYCIPRGNYTLNEGERISVIGFHCGNFGTWYLLGSPNFDDFNNSIVMDKLNFENHSIGEKARNKIISDLP
jgi:hypothetical protein